MACAGNTATTYTCPFINNTTYTWSVIGGSIVSTNGSNTIDVLWNAGGNNSITLMVSNVSGCDSAMVLPVTVGMLTPVSVNANTYSGCPPLSVSFSGNAPAPGQTYTWTFGDQLYSASANPTHVYDSPGIYNLTVITQNGGCTDTATATVTVFDVPDAEFTHNYESTPYYIGESTLQLTNTTTGGTSYLWTFGTGDTSNVFEPNIGFEESGTYLIQLFSFSTANCPDTAVKEIRVRNREHIYVPNAFTPNGDNVNDYFRMRTIHIEKVEVVILNRWGQKLFESNDVSFKWDGNFKGQAVEMGVYVYKIKAWGESGKDYNLIGTVTIYR
jgi:gliding motility-associated-like protein